MFFFKKENLIIILNILIIILFLNLGIIFFAEKIFNQKFFPRNLLNYFSKYYAIYYPDINDRSFNNYTAIIGDSYAFGSGDEFLENSYNYSIGHYLRQLNPNVNIVNFGLPGAGNKTSVKFFLDSLNKKFIFPDIRPPNNIIFLFYEGNDLENNIHYYNAGDKLRDKVFFVKKIIDYVPLFNFIFGTIKSLFINFKTNEIKKVNTIEIDNILIKITEVQAPPIELSSKQLDISINLLEESLIDLRNNFPKTHINLIYIPSPATILNFKNEIFFQTYFKSKDNLIKKSEIINLSNKLRARINLISQKLNLNLIDTTNPLLDTSINEYLYGEKDPKHFNKKGYKALSKIICSEIKCK